MEVYCNKKYRKSQGYQEAVIPATKRNSNQDTKPQEINYILHHQGNKKHIQNSQGRKLIYVI